MNPGDVICFRHVRVYPQNGPKKGARLEYVDFSTKGTDQEFVAMFLGAKSKGKDLEMDKVMVSLKKLGFVDVEEVLETLENHLEPDEAAAVLTDLGFDVGDK